MKDSRTTPALALVAGLVISSVATANGVFNGPVTGGDLAPLESGRETRLSTFLERHRDCAAESFKDIYRQVYPEYRGNVVSTRNKGPIKADDTEPEGLFYYDRDGVKRVYGIFFIGPEDAGVDLDAPPQLVFLLNGDFYTRGATARTYKPAPGFDGTVYVTQFESNPDVQLIAKFPGVRFDVEKRVDSYDALGRPVNERNVVSGLGLVTGPDFGPRVEFTNPKTKRPTAITWNATAFASCLAVPTPAR